MSKPDVPTRALIFSSVEEDEEWYKKAQSGGAGPITLAMLERAWRRQKRFNLHVYGSGDGSAPELVSMRGDD